MIRNLLFILFSIFILNASAQQKLKLKTGRAIRCNVYQICEEGVKFKKDSLCYFVRWPAIAYIKYKDGSKVRPDKKKYSASDTAGSIRLIANSKHDSIKKAIIPFLVTGTSSNDSVKKTSQDTDCADADFDKGYHDANDHYKGKGIGLLSAASTFAFLPAGLTFQLVFKHTRPMIRKNEIPNAALRKNNFYMNGYRLRAIAKRNIKMLRGFWVGVVTLAGAETGLSLYLKDHPSHGGGGGYHGD